LFKHKERKNKTKKEIEKKGTTKKPFIHFNTRRRKKEKREKMGK
jgi:hypothetical protein